jgi:L-fuculose-phosphate aldolase
MHSEEKGLIADLMEFGQKALQKNLIWANSGNVSHRLESNKIIITRSGASLGELNEDDFTVRNVNSDKPEGGGKPSMESKMHMAFYKRNNEVNAVFHSQAFFTTLISCTDLEVDNKLFPESMAYLERIGRVPNHHPGSQELADAVGQEAGECDCIILSNHGAICGAVSLEKVLLKTETLELLCRLTAMANIDNIELNYLPQDVRDDFLRHLEKIKKNK